MSALQLNDRTKLERVGLYQARLCQNASRKSIVGFRAHGQSKERVNRRLRVLQ